MIAEIGNNLRRWHNGEFLMKVAIVGDGYLGTVTAQHLPAKPDYSTTATTKTLG